MSDSNRKCHYCTEDLLGVHIRCTDCPSPVDLCPECFAAGSEFGTHRADHGFKIMDSAEFAIFQGSNWSASDQLLLLDAIEQFGYGNWEDTSRQINQEPQPNPKSAIDTKEEFCHTFITGVIGRHTWRDDARGRVHDHTQLNPLLPPSQPTEPPPNLTLQEAIQLGYMPKRDDFEVEYDNSAEHLVSQLQNNGGTEEDDMDEMLKIAHVDMYKFKLRERERRKRVARDHQLITQYFKENPFSMSEKKSGGFKNKSKKDKNDICEKLKILAEFQGVKEHQTFIASVSKEKELKNRIRDLQRYRKNGVSRLAEGSEFDVQRIRRNRKRKSELLEGSSPVSIKSEDFNNGSPLTALSPVPVQQQNNACPEKITSIVGLPGYDVLSSNEKKLCMNLRLTPAHYISYKTCLLTHHIQKKKGQTPKPLHPSGLDKNNRRIIFNFLMRSGWISAY